VAKIRGSDIQSQQVHVKDSDVAPSDVPPVMEESQVELSVLSVSKNMAQFEVESLKISKKLMPNSEY
jgi:hypothetical protein